MVNKYFFILLIFIFPLSAEGQNDANIETLQMLQSEIIQYIELIGGKPGEWIYNEKVEGEFFHFSASKNPLDFTTKHFIIENPYYNEDYNYYEDHNEKGKNYPLSYSVILDDNLISLFQDGKFSCYNLESFERNIEFESKLNTKKFKYHWIIDNKLCALSGSKIYEWNNEKWVRLKTKIPLDKQPKLFEDDEFLVFCDCFGEWGGTVYFFDKLSEEIFFTNSTCANSVIKEGGKYLVLSNLGHFSGSSELKSIKNPRNLTKAKKREINKTKNGEALGYSDKSEAYEKLIDMYGMQLFSSFMYSNKQLYVAHIFDSTFLVEINGTEIEIVHPFFKNDLYTHQSVTTDYGKYTLMNLDHYGTALDREISVIVIQGNQVTKLDWNKKHN